MATPRTVRFPVGRQARCVQYRDEWTHGRNSRYAVRLTRHESRPSLLQWLAYTVVAVVLLACGYAFLVLIS